MIALSESQVACVYPDLIRHGCCNLAVAFRMVGYERSRARAIPAPGEDSLPFLLQIPYYLHYDYIWIRSY